MARIVVAGLTGAALALGLAACALPPPRDYLAEDAGRCAAIGFEPGSEAMARCIASAGSERRAAADREAWRAAQDREMRARWERQAAWEEWRRAERRDEAKRRDRDRDGGKDRPKGGKDKADGKKDPPRPARPKPPAPKPAPKPAKPAPAPGAVVPCLGLGVDPACAGAAAPAS